MFVVPGSMAGEGTASNAIMLNPLTHYRALHSVRLCSAVASGSQ